MLSLRPIQNTETSQIQKLIKLKESETYSWIFMAIALASELEPTNFRDISNIADSINHAVPTHKEMQTSINWLSKKGLIAKQGKKYILTPNGTKEYKTASRKAGTLMKIWKNLEISLDLD